MQRPAVARPRLAVVSAVAVGAVDVGAVTGGRGKEGAVVPPVEEAACGVGDAVSLPRARLAPHRRDAVSAQRLDQLRQQQPARLAPNRRPAPALIFSLVIFFSFFVWC